MRLNWVIYLLLFSLLIGACTAVPNPTLTATPTILVETPTMQLSPSATPESSEEVSPTLTLSPTITPDLRLKPEDWQVWPTIPDLSSAMLEVYLRGQIMGRDPHVFSVIGDCQSSPTYFLSIYDEGRYTLESDQAYLQETIDWYAGSYSHRSLTVKNGMTAPGALNPLWADLELCESKETPVECEIRLNNPTLVLISLGTNWLPGTTYDQYVDYLQQIVQNVLDQNVIPILSTKADNAEGDYNRNLAVAQVAYDFDLPLWNFWAAVKDIPNYGLDKDRANVYLNYKGWNARNQSALVLLDHIHRILQEVEE